MGPGDGRSEKPGRGSEGTERMDRLVRGCDRTEGTGFSLVTAAGRDLVPKDDASIQLPLFLSRDSPMWP